ncbi:MAG: MBL fold metallo-hydrolase [Gemmatimonadota bacterium]
MHGLGLDTAALDLVAVTHRHQDHVADLLPLLFALRYTPGLNRERPLSLVGYPGLRADLNALASIYGDWVTAPGFPLEIWEAGDTPLEIERDEASVELEACPVVHTPEAVGFRLTFELEGREVLMAYTGDTEYCEPAVELARDADLLIAECSAADEMPVSGHLTPRALGRLAAEADCSRLVATHFYPSALALGWSEIERRIRERFGELPVDLGADGLEIEL